MYILEFLLENKNTSYKYFEKVFWCKFKIQNVLISYAIKQIGKLRHDDAYIQEKEDYKTYKTVKDSGLDKDKITSAMNERIIYYGLTKDDFEQYVKVQQKVCQQPDGTNHCKGCVFCCKKMFIQ
jgi:hypothetical protein